MIKENNLECFVPYFEAVKMQSPIVIGWTWATFATLFQTYIFNDWAFLIYLVILILLDTILGVWRAYKYHQINSSKFGGFIIKVVLYAIFMVVVHNLSNFSTNEFTKSIFRWVQELCYAAVVVREAISIIENIGAIRKGLIPEWILKRLKTYDEKGNFEG